MQALAQRKALAAVLLGEEAGRHYHTLAFHIYHKPSGWQVGQQKCMSCMTKSAQFVDHYLVQRWVVQERNQGRITEWPISDQLGLQVAVAVAVAIAIDAVIPLEPLVLALSP